MLHILLFIYHLFIYGIQATPVQLEARAVDAGTLAQLNLYAQYSRADYCSNNNQSPPGTAITCRNNTCPLVEADKTTALVEFQNLGTTDGTGYVAVDHTKKQIILVFRGTRSVPGFLADFSAIFIPWDLCSGCQVHAGFKKAWDDVKPVVQPVLDSALEQWPTYSTIITGHSLGASIAALGAADLRASGYEATLFNYGQPMTVNVALANFITSQGRNYRVTNNNDYVPKLPGYLFGYGHISPEYWLTGSNYAPVKTSDVQVSSGAQNTQGNVGTSTASPDDHLFYFGYINGCGEGDEIL